MIQWLKNLYIWLVLKHPSITLIPIFILAAWMGSYASKFQFDASAETLLLKNDKDLNYYRSIKTKYGLDDYLILTYSPKKDVFSQSVLDDLQKLKQQLKQIKNVKDITSIIDVPLIKSPPVTYEDLSKQIITIENKNANLTLAKQELLISPFFRGLLLSKDGKSTALLIDIVDDNKDPRKSTKSSSKNANQIKQNIKEIFTKEIDPNRSEAIRKQHDTIEKIRHVMHNHSKNASLHLGGIPMIAADSITFIKHDFYRFGLIVTICIIVLLFLIFREIRWVILPLITCLLSGLFVMGLLGLIGWPVTVVSSNFPPLLLILTFSLIIYLIVSYRELELKSKSEDENGDELILSTLKSKFAPCFYTSGTSIFGFGSLVVSGIQPLIDFGLIMAIGLTISFILAFTFFPASLSLFKAKHPAKLPNLFTEKITLFIADSIQRWPNSILLVFVAFGIVSAIGISFLSVENRFIDYYKKSTEIYQGMELIDKQFGGTTPLEIIIDAPRSSKNKQIQQNEEGFAFDSYWLNREILGKITAIHLYLESLPHVGKVLSIATTMAILETIDPKTTLDNKFLSLVYEKFPPNAKKELISPYLSKDGDQLRISIRVFESDYNLKRNELLNRIRHDLTNKFNLEPRQIKLTGMLVLYDNVLQSFFKSQILTLGFVFIYMFFMFIVFFRSLTIALIALIPNIFSAVFVLGLMGWAGISLDLMTIVIAAITLGIGVDDSIHFTHRYMEEYRKSGDYWQAVKDSHRTVGLSMLFTSFIIALGFSILIFSNFVPTIYFGLLTSCAMLVALAADIILLPILLCKFKPTIK